MRFGVPLGVVHHRAWRDVAVAADELGYESLWLPEHLVLPVAVSGQLRSDEEHPPVHPDIPVFDAPSYLCHLAALTRRIRLGTSVYLLALRHPFVGARAFATLDVLSGGRAEVGVGAGWLRSEWTAAGIDPRTRGRRLDEAIDVCRQLWTNERIEHASEFWTFPQVGFEPKPVQAGGPPLSVGGESFAALRRAARIGDGWLGMAHDPTTAAAQIATLRTEQEAAGRGDQQVTVTVMATPRDEAELDAFARAGVDRMVVSPWASSRDAVPGLERFAAAFAIDTS